MKPDLGALRDGLETDALRLIDLFLRQHECEAVAPGAFAAAARGQNGESWATRRIAALLLENIAWRRAPGELLMLPALLGEDPEDPEEFVRGVQRRIGRLARIHAPLCAPEPTESAWANFLHVARQECRLTLGRWLFTTEAVMQEISARVTITKGACDRDPAIIRMHRWRRAPVSDLPPREAELVNALTAAHNIYWVTPRVGAELNALVAYPLNSAAMAIKPPGSDIEIQVKRSGLRGTRPLDVIFSRNGQELPSSHRVHGGSFGWLAKREARASDLFAKIYEAVHGEPCPCNRTVAITSVVEVPTERGPVHILDYLTKPDCFGEGFERLRSHMRRTAEMLPPDTAVKMPKYEGALGETLQFIAQAVPQQAIQIHTTSYRLERVLGWLTESGMSAQSAEDPRRFACDVLDEILAGMTLPGECGETYSEFVEACFAVPENRAGADECYLSLMEQTGQTWGTLLGVRGYTDGESFVSRNFGLRSVYNGGQWEVRMRFMDHDDMVVIGRDRQHFWPGRGLLGMSWDERHVVGGDLDGRVIKGVAGTLREIYRVSEELAASGIERLREAAKAAYRKTQTALRELPELRGLFSEAFVEGIGDLDAIVARFLDSSDKAAWRHETREFLAGKGYSRELAEDYVWAVQNRSEFVGKMAFLFAPDKSG